MLFFCRHPPTATAGQGHQQSLAAHGISRWAIGIAGLHQQRQGCRAHPRIISCFCFGSRGVSTNTRQCLKLSFAFAQPLTNLLSMHRPILRPLNTRNVQPLSATSAFKHRLDFRLNACTARIIVDPCCDYSSLNSSFDLLWSPF